MNVYLQWKNKPEKANYLIVGNVQKKFKIVNLQAFSSEAEYALYLEKLRMSYHFNEIEEKWQKYWAQNQTYKASNNSEKEKFYVLDMYPYTYGAGMHVEHTIGYITSDIYTRLLMHNACNMLHLLE